MKIALAGKGGAGKTTIAGNLARAFARLGHRVMAVDADPSPNLATTLGVGESEPPRFLSHDLVREAVMPDGRRAERLALDAETMLKQYGRPGPDNTWLVTVGTVEHAGTGCNCSHHSVVRGVLAELTAQPNWVSITDMEAGLEHLKRGTVREADALVIVIEPYYRSLETGGHLHDLAKELGVPRVFAAGNKARNQADREALTAFCQRHEMELIGIVPYDEAFGEADRQQLAAIDCAPDAPGVEAIVKLAEALTARLSA